MALADTEVRTGGKEQMVGKIASALTKVLLAGAILIMALSAPYRMLDFVTLFVTDQRAGELLIGLAWPLVTLTIVMLLRLELRTLFKALRYLIERTRKVKYGDAELDTSPLNQINIIEIDQP